MARMMVFFEYNGEWKTNGQVSYTWVRKTESSYTSSVAIKDDIKYVEMVNKLYNRLKVDSNEYDLKLSYMPIGFQGMSPVIIEDDESLNGLIWDYQAGHRSLLCVELIEKHNANDEGCDDIRNDIGDNDHCVGLEDDAVNVCDVASALGNKGVNLENEHVDMVEKTLVASAPTPSYMSYKNEDCESLMTEGNTSYSFTDGSDLAVGQEFASKADVARKVQEVAFAVSFEMSVDKSTKSLLAYKCVDKSCKWFLRAAKITNSEYFSIRTYCNTHTCDQRQRKKNHRQASQAIVAEMVIQNFHGQREAPTPKTIMTMIENHGMQISYSKAYRGKLLANNLLRGSSETSFEALPAYLYMVKKMNPQSVTELIVDNYDKFKYLFLAYGPCIKGLRYMRKVIALDETLLKGKYKGKMLVVTAQDGNHQQFPLAWGMVGSENDNSWGWFFEQMLKKGIVPDDDEVVFIFNHHQTIINEMRSVYSKASYGHCIWHIKNNLKCHERHEEAWNLFTIAARAYKMSEFHHYYNKLKNKYPKAYQYLEDYLDVHTWARAYFPTARFNIMTTNGGESINVVLREAREYPLIALLDKLQELTTTWFNSRRNHSRSCVSMLIPHAESILREQFTEATQMQIIQLNPVQYDVKGSDNNNFIVDFSTN